MSSVELVACGPMSEQAIAEVVGPLVEPGSHYDADCSHRCNGNCCRSFTVRYSPVEIGRERARGVVDDIVFIADMLVYQGWGQSNMVGDEVGVRTDGDPCHWYTCKHFDDPAGKCTVYSDRPRMCRSYPYREACTYTGCSYEKTARKT